MSNVSGGWTVERDWLIDQYSTQSIADIAALVDVSTSTVRRAMIRHNLPRRRRGDAARERISHPQLADRDWLTKRYSTSTIAGIATEVEVASETVRRALDLHGIELHTARRRPDPRRPAVLDDRDWLIERYESAWSIREIATELGVNEQLVGAALRRHGIVVRSERGSEHPRLVDPAWLQAAIADNGTTEIAQQLGVSRVGVQRALTRYAIASPRRYESASLTPPSESVLRAVWDAEQTIKGVAQRFSVSPTTAAVWLAQIAVFVSERPAISRRELTTAVSKGLTRVEIEQRFKVTGRTVVVELHRHGLFHEHRQRHVSQRSDS